MTSELLKAEARLPAALTRADATRWLEYKASGDVEALNALADEIDARTDEPLRKESMMEKELCNEK